MVDRPDSDDVPVLPWPAFDVEPPSRQRPDHHATPVRVRSDLPPVSDELVGGVNEPLGQFHFDVVADRWWWSDELYDMYGFAKSSVVPTHELLWAHTHPADRVAATELISTALAMGGHFSLRHRIIDTQQRVHTVVSLGTTIVDEGTVVTALSGYVVDISRWQQPNPNNDIHHPTFINRERAALIEQAKGALRARYGCSTDEAFGLLKWRSQHANLKLHAVAARLMATLHTPGPDSFDAFDGLQSRLQEIRFTAVESRAKSAPTC